MLAQRRDLAILLGDPSFEPRDALDQHGDEAPHRRRGLRPVVVGHLRQLGSERHQDGLYTTRSSVGTPLYQRVPRVASYRSVYRDRRPEQGRLPTTKSLSSNNPVNGYLVLTALALVLAVAHATLDWWRALGIRR